MMASAGMIGMSISLATNGRCGRQHRGRCCGGGVGIREIHSIAHGPVLEWRFKLNKQEDRHVDGSKRKIRKKKRKADKNQPKTHVSAYKAAQGEDKPSFSLFARKT